MKPFHLHLLICFVLAVPLFIGGINLYSFIIENMGQTKILVNTIGGPFRTAAAFGLVIALIPFALVLCWKFTPVTGKMKRFWTTLIVVGCSFFLLVFRISTVKRQIQALKIPEFENYTHAISHDTLRLEFYFFGGLIAGLVIVYFGFRKNP